MTLSIIVAIAKDRAIGKSNQLLWHISEDLRRFKAITIGKPIIMGRKTYESIGKPLPGRRNLIITRNVNCQIEGCECYSSIEDAIETCKQCDEVFIIGGGEIYKQTMSIADKLYLTVVDYKYDADTFFPEINMMEWEETSLEHFSKGEKFPHPFTFINYTKRTI